MSVRATSQPIGAATTQQAMLDDTAMITVVIRGSMKVGSSRNFLKLSSVKVPLRSVRLKYSSHDIGRTMMTHSSAAEKTRIGQERSIRNVCRAGSAGKAMV